MIVFGPDQLPKVARKAGQVVRDVQSTSQTFIREMERAADENEHKEWVATHASVPPVEHIAEPTPAAGAFVEPHHVPPSEAPQPPHGAAHDTER